MNSSEPEGLFPRSLAELLRPRMLAPGDRLAAVSLSWGGAGKFPHRFEAGRWQLQDEFGVELVATRHALRDPDWLGRNPQARADDLMEAFADPGIAGIISCIGGDDSIRLLGHVDLSVIADNKKVFMGYSDTTVTHFMCLAAGIAPYYGPAILAGFCENGGLMPYLIESVRRTLFSSEAPGVMKPNPDGWTVEFIDWADPANQERRRRLQPAADWKFLQGAGAARGRLVGGCLEVLSWLRGTALWPDAAWFEGAILFIETSEEAPPPEFVTRELRALAAGGVLGRLAGLLVGRPGGEVPPERFGEYDDAVMRVVAQEEGLVALPVVTRMDFGHTDPMMVLPYGVLAQIDCDRGEFALLEGAVTPH